MFLIVIDFLENSLTILLLTAFGGGIFFAFNSILNRQGLCSLSDSAPKRQPLVSVLIPCRNEEEHIASCLDSFLAQNYCNLEILILDDHSNDDSAIILANYENKYENLTILKGKELPEGWTGKNWACHQLYEHSQGEILLYCDADTKADSSLIKNAISELELKRLGFLTIFPQRNMINLFDRAVWSFTSWVIASWIPLWLAYKTRIRFFAVGFGQFLMLRRSAYEAVGGYDSLRNRSLDDFEIARRIQLAGIDWRVYRSIGRLTTESYKSTKETVDGYGKSIFPALGANGLVLVVAWLFLANLAWTPVIVLILESLDWITVTSNQLQLASLAVIAVLSSWAFSAVNLRINTIAVLLYPISISTVLYTAIASYITIRRGVMRWKDRIIRNTDELGDYQISEETESLEDVSETSTGKSEP